jgi:hypothetical protein
MQAFAWEGAAQQLGPPSSQQAQRRLALTMLLPVMDVLERRRIAGTLLYGKCAPHEEQWLRRWIDPMCEGDVDPSDDVTKDDWAPFIGYEAYLKAAQLALLWLRFDFKVLPATAEQRPKAFSFVLSALDLMCAPRPFECASCYSETRFLVVLRNALSRAAMGDHFDALLDAHDRLQASGSITRHGMELDSPQLDAKHKASLATAQADVMTRGLQSCAHCSATESHVAQFKRCSACKAVVFCGKDCQLANWPAHKAACKAARKAAAAGDNADA